MKIEIIEDCSPYFIRYTHTGIDDIISLCLEHKVKVIDTMIEKRKFMHCVIDEPNNLKIFEKVYRATELSLMKKRVSLFVTQSGHYYRPHRDGMSTPMGINYTVDIKDDQCITSWYDNDVFKDRPIDNLRDKGSREIADYNRSTEKNVIKPIKSMIAKQGEAILFNTDFYHDFDNSNSINERTILTLRSLKLNDLNFFQARHILFNF